jgi:hypothetical protein
MLAKEITSKIEAGLQLAGQNEDGDLEWMGTAEEWRLSEDIEDAKDLINETCSNSTYQM